MRDGLKNLMGRFLQKVWLARCAPKCLVCKHHSLEFVSGGALLHTYPKPTPNYYQCRNCGARAKSFGHTHFEDASGRDDVLYYNPRYVGHKDYQQWESEIAKAAENNL